MHALSYPILPHWFRDNQISISRTFTLTVLTVPGWMGKSQENAWLFPPLLAFDLQTHVLQGSYTLCCVIRAHYPLCLHSVFCQAFYHLKKYPPLSHWMKSPWPCVRSMWGSHKGNKPHENMPMAKRQVRESSKAAVGCAEIFNTVVFLYIPTKWTLLAPLSTTRNMHRKISSSSNVIYLIARNQQQIQYLKSGSLEK